MGLYCRYYEYKVYSRSCLIAEWLGGIKGSGNTKVPDQGLKLGDATEKTTADLISTNTKIAWSSNVGTVTGDIKYISDFSELFGDAQKSGHFFPILLDAKYKGKDLVCSGRTDGDRPIHVDDDLLLIVRIENLTQEKKIILKDDGSVIMTIDVSKAKLNSAVGEGVVSVASQSEDMDSVKPASELIDENVKIAWTETTGEMSGNVHFYHFKNGHFAKKPTGHYVPVVISGYDGQVIDATGSDGTGSKLEDPKWIIRVDDFIPASKKATLACNGVTLAQLGFNGLTLEPPTGEEAFDAAKKDYGGYGHTDKFYSGVTITWDGINATVKGTLNWIAEGTVANLKTAGNYFAFALLGEWFNGKTITVEGNNIKSEEATDWVCIVTDKSKPFIVKLDETTIAKFDLSAVTLGVAA